MKKHHYLKRLLKLAAFLSRLPKEKFYFGNVIEEKDSNGCGSVCCAIGWTPAVFPKLVNWKDGRLGIGEYCKPEASYIGLAMNLFNLSIIDARYLFSPHGAISEDNSLQSTATNEEVANHIRNYVKANSI